MTTKEKALKLSDQGKDVHEVAEKLGLTWQQVAGLKAARTKERKATSKTSAPKTGAKVRFSELNVLQQREAIADALYNLYKTEVEDGNVAVALNALSHLKELV